MDDLVLLDTISEPKIVDALQNRYAMDQVSADWTSQKRSTRACMQPWPAVALEMTLNDFLLLLPSDLYEHRLSAHRHQPVQSQKRNTVPGCNALRLLSGCCSDPERPLALDL